MIRGLRTRKGIMYSCLALGLLALWLGPVVARGFLLERSDPSSIRSLAPLGMLGLLLLNLLLMKRETGIQFGPAEIDFLFPGPFRRRELLAYKMVGMSLDALVAALWFSLIVLPYVKFWIAGFLGLTLTLAFFQLFQLAVILIAATVAERAFTMWRKVALAVIGIAIVIGLAHPLSSVGDKGFMAVVSRFRESWIGAGILAPFEVFGRTIAAETLLPELLGWGLAGLTINALLALLVIRLDADFMEASVVASQKFYERIQRVRQGGTWVASQRRGTPRRIPQPPWLGGAGPVAWRQMTTAVRGAKGIVFMLVIFGVSAGLPMMLIGKTPGGASGSTIGILAMMSLFFLPQMIRFDFRADLDRIETLKTLPITTTAIVIGELLTVILCATFLQILFVAVLAIIEGGVSMGLALAIVFCLPINVLVFGLENLMFLLFPYRPASGTGMDMQTMGRQMVLMFLKFIVLLLVVGVAAGIGGVVYLMTDSMIATVVALWASSMLLSVGIVPAVSLAYRRFDPSMDTPP